MLNSNHAARRAVPKQPLIYAATPRANSSGTNSATCTVGITGRAGRDAAGRGMCRLQTLNVSSQLPRGRTRLFRQLWAVTSIESRDLLPVTDVSERGGEEERRTTRRWGKIIGMTCLLDCPQIGTCRRTFSGSRNLFLTYPWLPLEGPSSVDRILTEMYLVSFNHTVFISG